MSTKKQTTVQEHDPMPKAAAVLSMIPGGRASGVVSADDYQRMSDEQSALIMKTYFPDLNKDEVSIFIDFCDIYKADPRKKEAWATIRWSKKKGNDGRDIMNNGQPVYERRVVMGLSKNKVQQRLEERPDFTGIESAVVYEKDGFTADLGAGLISHKVNSINLAQRGMMVAAWCRISRKNKSPYIRLLYASERQDDRNFNWNKMGPTMLLKCVEMDSVRACYPKDFGGVFDEAEADTFGETLPAGQMEEVAATIKESVPTPAKATVEFFTKETVPTPTAAPFDLEAPSRGGAFVSADQLNALKALAQEFRLAPVQMGDAVEKAVARRPKALADLTKPEFQKIVKLFDGVRDGSYQMSGGKILKPEDIDALNEQAKKEDLPF